MGLQYVSKINMGVKESVKIKTKFKMQLTHYSK